MQNEEFNECFHSAVLLTNIKRWNKISNKFHFGDSTKNKHISIIFDAYCCAKRKLSKNLNPIFELFNDIEGMIISEYVHLLSLSLELGQNKMLDSIVKIIGDKKAFELINELYPKLTNNMDKNTSGLKLCKRYIKLYYFRTKEKN